MPDQGINEGPGNREMHDALQEAPPIRDREDRISEIKRPVIPRLETLRQYSININFQSVGCVIQVGCKSIAFRSIDEAMIELNEYVKNPNEAYDKWMKIMNAND